MEKKKRRLPGFFNVRTIGFRIFVTCLADCVILVFALMALFADVTVEIGENFTADKFRSDIEDLSGYINSEISSGAWYTADGCLYKGDVRIGDGTLENSNFGMFGGVGSVSENYCFIAMKQDDGRYVAVAGSLGEESGKDFIGAYLENKDAKKLEETGSCTGRKLIGKVLIFSYATKIYDANGNAVGALLVAEPMDYIYSMVRSISFAVFAVTIGVIILAFISILFVSLHWTRSVASVNEYFKRIGDGDIPEEKLESSKYAELSAVSENVNNMVAALRSNERISAELAIASGIQSHMLPSVFPPFPGIKEFDIYASMDAAKEVGGDFYDFFMVDETHLGVVIADVSGKGIPAAMFMVTARTLIKDHATLGLSPSEIFERVNNILCEGNVLEMFVTAWMGILDTVTGELRYANAGHNPPVLGKDGKFGFLRCDPCLVLACVEDMEYEDNTVMLAEGSRLFLYTDGVTEAMDGNDGLYGEERLLAFFNRGDTIPASELTSELRKDVDAFTKGAEQSDDMTMLVLDFNSRKAKTDVRVFPAEDAELDSALDFVEEKAVAAGFGGQDVFRIRLAAEEIFVNISHYAYDGGSGTAEIAVTDEGNRLAVRFTDSGREFNTLEKVRADVDGLAESDEIGGLGLHIVGTVMDELAYEYSGGRNIFTMIKNKPQEGENTDE